MLGNMTEKPALSRLTYWEGGAKKIYCTPFVPRVLLTSLTLLLRRVKAHYFNCLLQQKAQTNPRHFANAILLILDVLLPIALNFYCFSFMRKKKKGLLPWLWWQIYYQLTLPDDYQLPPNLSPTCFFNLLMVYSLKNSSLRRGDIHIGKLFCWSLFTKVKSVQHKIVRAFLIQIIYFWGVIVLRDYHRLKNFGLKGLLKVT